MKGLRLVNKKELAKEDELEHVNRRQWSMWTPPSNRYLQNKTKVISHKSLTTQRHTEQQTTLTFQRKQVEELESRRGRASPTGSSRD